MAWISVDQKLIGGKLRSLYKSIGCSQNEAMGILVFLWLWGIDNAGMDGLIISADRSDIADVLKPGLAPGLDAETVVESLIQNRWIDEVDGELYFHDWSEWRSYYNKYIGEKKKHAERMRRYRSKNSESDEKCDAESDVTSDVTPNDTPEQETPPEAEKKTPKYDKDFETFWAAYPRKADKGQCYKKYKARIYAKYNGVDKQFPFYEERTNRIVVDEDGDTTWRWLASPGASSTTNFCSVDGGGFAGGGNASHSFGVAPGFVIRKS